MKNHEKQGRNGREIPKWVFRLGLASVIIAILAGCLTMDDIVNQDVYATQTAVEELRDTFLMATEQAKIDNWEPITAREEEILGKDYLLATHKLEFVDGDGVRADAGMGLLYQTREVENGWVYGLFLATEHVEATSHSKQEDGEMGRVESVLTMSVIPADWLESLAYQNHEVKFIATEPITNEEGIVVAQYVLTKWYGDSRSESLTSYGGSVGGPCSINPESRWAYVGVPISSSRYETPIMRIISGPFTPGMVNSMQDMPGYFVQGLANGGDSGSPVKDLGLSQVCALVQSKINEQSDRFGIVFLPAEDKLESQAKSILDEAEKWTP